MQSSNGRLHHTGDGPESADGTQEEHAEHDGHSCHGSCRDPWHDEPTTGWGTPDGAGGPAPDVPPARLGSAATAMSVDDVYVEVQRSAAFQEVRGRYRRFVVPGVTGFLTWYVGYVIAATAAPGFMARPVVGAVNVALVAGLGQFLTTFLLTWAYARHARLRRDPAALELRWTTQELTRGARRCAR
ncbi:DUF485 domain-containing protein [Streptomyces sp. NPDC017248]|uniref:DUF485 domain-containing protein n=1 Tax=unclassified Streptomyces TaxID=2593676 RepID=UPI00343EA684